ncbi:MAG: hypothetical protein FE78DRAFT_30224 [Acidomyces sp. 'richmondensis']|nr:MAG: hypothetical protein FE78DRAFT_30224 [Acidomyces sp. 'richmondensis']
MSTILKTSSHQKKVKCLLKRTLFYLVAGCSTLTLCIELWEMLFSTSNNPYLERGIPSNYLDMLHSHAIKNTVIIVPINMGMLHWAKNLLCSLSVTSFDTSKIVFWALDQGAESALNQTYATYRDKSLFSTSLNENKHGNTRAYRRMMKERPKFFIDILSSGFNILMLDADTVFWQSPLSLVPEEHDNVDAVFSTDAREFYQTHNAFLDARRRGSRVPPVCNGIFWMKSNSKTLATWSDMLNIVTGGVVGPSWIVPKRRSRAPVSVAWRTDYSFAAYATDRKQ